MQSYFKYGDLESNPKYSCVNVTLTFEELSARHVKRPFIGLLFITVGVLFEIAYILSLSVIWYSDLLKMSCFKLMFALGVLDCLTIILCNFYTGYLYVIGFEYCMYPYTSYFVGVLLADYGTFIFHPFIPGKEELQYTSIFQTTTNTFVSIAISLCYIAIYSSYMAKVRLGTSQSQNRFQRKILIQTTLVCLPTLSTASLWASFAFVSPSAFLMHLAHLSWQLMHGMPAIVYLFVNKTIQKRAFRRIAIWLNLSASRGGPYADKIQPMPCQMGITDLSTGQQKTN
ncbi:unnamed protein product, partial [Mesorhabditis belari]|uniref:G protein-coupled receptor n=1 Tax=Mesorhabditis belari TaxID=2138241 RepID=A0AAF3FFN8_9BILA